VAAVSGMKIGANPASLAARIRAQCDELALVPMAEGQCGPPWASEVGEELRRIADEVEELGHAPAAAPETIAAATDALDEDAFEALVAALRERRCLHCGRRDPTCQCSNDE
jgi:hypothetical protein